MMFLNIYTIDPMNRQQVQNKHENMKAGSQEHII